MKQYLFAFAAIVASSGLANASLIPFLSGISPSGPNFDFNYSVTLSGDERMDPAATNGVTCPAFGGAKVQCNPAGTFFTVYDIPGLVSASAPAGWGVVSMNNGLTPSSIIGPSVDNPNIPNVSFVYTGPVIHGVSTGVTFNNFHIISHFGATANGNFSSQSTKDTGDSIGNTDQVSGPTTVPSGVPEPASMVLIGSGMLGLALFRRRKAQS